MIEPLPWVLEWLEKTNSKLPPPLHYHAADVVNLVAEEHDLDPAEAQEAVFGPMPHKGRDWKEYAEYLKSLKMRMPLIVLLVTGQFSVHESVVRTFLDDSGKYAESQKRADRAYWERVQQDAEKHEARKAAMRAYYYANRDHIRQQQNEYKRQRKNSS